MELTLRTAVLLGMLLLLGCRPQAAAPDVSSSATDTASEQVQATSGQVSIQGDDALASVLSWSLPAVSIESQAQAKREIRMALQQGDLFETGESAIPLALALHLSYPEDAQAEALLQEAQAALMGQAWMALDAGDDVASLRFAQRHSTVLRTLWPDQPEVQQYLQAVDRVEKAFDLTVAGEQALHAGRLDDEAGALPLFRQALAYWPVQRRAQQGIDAVEAALLALARADADASDFDAANLQLARAEQARKDSVGNAETRAYIDAARVKRIRRLGDEGLIALGHVDLQLARERLADILRIAKPGDRVSVLLRERIDRVSHYGLFRPRQVFTDALADGRRAPSLMVIPHGDFLMGAPADEDGASADEQPQHLVQFERGFAMSRFEVTVGEFRQFIEATGYVPRSTHRQHSMTYDVRSGNFMRGSGIDWRSSYDGKPATDDLPVMHVTARDAEAYTAWLTEQTGAYYRLPSEAEFEYALRAGGQGTYPWGEGRPPEGFDNLAGSEDVSPQGRHWKNAFAGYADGWWGPAPVGSFSANAFGLYDMGGNVSEGVADCWHKGYRRAPANGAAWVNPGCRVRMYRGGAWSSAPTQARSAWRTAGGVDVTNARVGFRLVRQI